MSIRNAAKAVIVRDGKVLLNKCVSSFGDEYLSLPNGMVYYDMPGGGQEQYETLEEAVIREVLEETGYTVKVIRLAAIYEEIAENGAFRVKFKNYAHKVGFVFLCEITDENAKKPSDIDCYVVGLEWIPLDGIRDIVLWPPVAGERLHDIINTKEVLYLGAKRYP